MTLRTLYDKLWDDHVVTRRPDGTCVIAIDRHIIHEVTTPQAFEGLRLANRSVRYPRLTLAMPDHNVPTSSRSEAVADPDSAHQIALLKANCARYGIEHIDIADPDQGIVHVVGPEQGFTLPGSTLVCGDSHTSTHGALGALAFGIGTSEVEHVLATQALLLSKSLNMAVEIDGDLPAGVSAKDVALELIRRIGTAGGTGHVIEFMGTTVRNLSIEARMSLCNMAIEAGARSGIVAPDDTTFAYLKGRPRAPHGPEWEKAVARWRSLITDPGAYFDKRVRIEASAVAPIVTWGTSPQDSVPVTGNVPHPEEFEDPGRREAARVALDYMGLEGGTAMRDVAIDHVFIGSCTNSRLEDLRIAAAIVAGRQVAPNVLRALVVPGSGLVKRQAEEEGLDKLFLAAGMEWREPGCSMCLGMNPDRIPAGGRCASTSNRNFAGRQGPGVRTHLMSPAMAAAAAITGRISDVRELVS